MKKPKHYTKSVTGLVNFCCPICQNKLLTVSVVHSSMFLTCTICHKESMYSLDELSLGNLTPLFAQMQEPAVQVPATAPAAGHLTELTVYCPACDFSGATATQHAPDSLDHHITCSNCGFDGDRNKITLVS